MEKINFEDATLQKGAYVIIDGKEYNVNEATYTGGTELNAEIFNTLQTNIENAIGQGEQSINNVYKFTNGLMVILHSEEPLAKTTTQTFTISLADSFIDTNYKVITSLGASDSGWEYVKTNAFPYTENSIKYQIKCTSSATAYVTVDFIIIGKWK